MQRGIDGLVLAVVEELAHQGYRAVLRASEPVDA